uniref:Uncharacterized protein n=1 Tax=Siphoviridae sp. ctB3v5 TaxID=2826186 RepID=A0A8S5M8M4_9CAUD|nr:MAG TPA: hypothetical protein [Siphoviridae sp. ctB3v5]
MAKDFISFCFWLLAPSASRCGAQREDFRFYTRSTNFSIKFCIICHLTFFLK